MGKPDSVVTGVGSPSPSPRDVESAIDSSEAASSTTPALHVPHPEHMRGPEEVVPGVTEWRDGAPRPRWAQKTADHIPLPVKKTWLAIVKWVNGPVPPKIWRITPFFPKIQTAPLKLVDRIAPRFYQKFFLLVAVYVAWLIMFVAILHNSAFTNKITGYGHPTLISCTATYWQPDNGCGVNGNDCRPFQNASQAFRCPAHCLATNQLTDYAVGTQNVIYQPLVVGGPNDTSQSVQSAFYRGDSFICASAIHAGYFGDTYGGCGVLELVGSRANYPAINQNGVSSTGFDSNFPLSYRFLPSKLGDCRDLRWPLLAVSVGMTVILALFTASAPVFFWSTFVCLFVHCALVSDPPDANNYYERVSIMAGRFLPASFVMGIMYQFCVRRQLHGLQAQVEKAILWLGACWVGTLNNYTFDKIPIQRLTPSDLKQPGAVTALVIIVLVIVCIAVGQAWAINREGRMPRYLALYGFMGFCLLMLLAIPNENLRIHHYILGLLLLPGTAMQTRPSLLYQGLLVGLFINGIARWNFDSIIQTSGELYQGGPTGSILPQINMPVISGSNITFVWPDFPSQADGISVLVNDVERFRSYVYDGTSNFTWTRRAPAGDPEYFRFGYMSGSSSLDYTKAGVWNSNGSWTPMAEGST